MNTYPLPYKKIIYQVVIVLLTLVGLSLLAAGSVHASAGGYAGKWLLHLSFPNDQPEVELTTEIWFDPGSGTPYLVTSQTEALNCTVTGNLQVSNEIATFTGQEYISCVLPDMGDKFDEVSEGVLNSVPENVLARNPYVAGQVKAAGNNPSVTLPVFYHASIQYGLNRISATQAQQTFRVDGSTAISSSFVQALPYDLRADLQIRPNGNYRTIFTANGVSSPGVPAVLASGLFVNHGETTVHFGYSPDNGSYFVGDISTLTVDPGVFGRD